MNEKIKDLELELQGLNKELDDYIKTYINTNTHIMDFYKKINILDNKMKQTNEKLKFFKSLIKYND